MLILLTQFPFSQNLHIFLVLIAACATHFSVTVHVTKPSYWLRHQSKNMKVMSNLKPKPSYRAFTLAEQVVICFGAPYVSVPRLSVPTIELVSTANALIFYNMMAESSAVTELGSCLCHPCTGCLVYCFCGLLHEGSLGN
ncbi:hypothetical protein VNO77_27759 [Canavalia gladiata]|uniref:Uncharacterized protein n=1 Tax=Canavalia gladiata TaxID=3824 RepID=A0AAN9Q4E4_CANGL